MKPDWPISRVYWERQHIREYANYFGYATLVRNLERCVVHDETATLALRVQDPDNLKLVNGRRLLVFSMWESSDFPIKFVTKLRQAEAILAPSTFCQRMFERVADCAVYRVPLAVNVDQFSYVKRQFPVDGTPFRWLWLNAPDVRKGYELLGKMWDRAGFGERDDLELYMKTTAASGGRKQRVGKNIWFDSRVLPREELVQLYHSAHGFLYPSLGEGFGLTLAEAMATGLPCVATAYSGVTDFFGHGTGFVANHTIHRVGRPGDEGRTSDAYDGLYEVAMPDMKSFVVQMDKIYSDYRKAVEVGLRASRLINDKFTMTSMATALSAAIEKHL